MATAFRDYNHGRLRSALKYVLPEGFGHLWMQSMGGHV